MSEFTDILMSRVDIKRLNKISTSLLGQPVNQETTIYSSLPVRFEAIKGSIRMMAAGQQKVAQYKIYAEAGKDIRENDFVYAISGIAGLTRARVSFVDQMFDFDGITHHLECELETP